LIKQNLRKQTHEGLVLIVAWKLILF